LCTNCKIYDSVSLFIFSINVVIDIILRRASLFSLIFCYSQFFINNGKLIFPVPFVPVHYSIWASANLLSLSEYEILFKRRPKFDGVLLCFLNKRIRCERLFLICIGKRHWNLFFSKLKIIFAEKPMPTIINPYKAVCCLYL
jgi:hypothetical protein